ncbi:glucans biosynthesis protein [Allorhodopirellula solitaria]|uniref:Glucans biosynthesis protein n=2 Tax=Allorhodopirellula solitaria TaxID=2527987 RepID=A0A5C5XR24_9BACT|nr:glucans biosynthesis protein [Allorhodopirellula solitaria]
MVAGQHFAGIDALRGYAAVAVVLLHACVPYARPSMAGLSWSVHDTPSDIVTALFWAIELVIMPIFLVIAGFFAARSVSSRGGWSVTMQRLQRLGKPLAWALVLMLPLEFYIWMLGWVADGSVSIREVRRIKFAEGIDRNLWGLSHLWFLQYLMIYTVILASVWPRLSRCSTTTLVRFGLPCTFAAAVISLTMRPEVVWGFQHSFLPVLSKWVYSGAFFTAGVFWYSLDPQLSELGKRGQRLLGPGVLLSAAAVSMGIWWLNAAGDPATWLSGGWANAPAMNGSLAQAGGFPIGSVWMRGGLATLSVGAASLLTFGLLGIAATRQRPLGRGLASLAAASFLIYLLHHPIVGLASTAAKYAMPGASPLFKVAVVTTLGVAAGWSVSWLATCRRERIWEQTHGGEVAETIEFPRVGGTDRAEEKAA